MDFDLQWLLLGLPVAFAFGWLASRLDLRQWRRDSRDAPRAYFKGLNLLLNEQQDKAIDAFIEAVQQDPDTSDLHFALGNLFRRRGEYERAVRVHEHLLNRADLSRADRDRAQHALAQDFARAGLFDRAEAAWKALEGTAFDTEARLALLSLHERSRDWHAAIEVAQQLERSGTGSYAPRIAHYWCELVQEADGREQEEAADTALRRATEAAPLAPRPRVLGGQRARQRGQHAQALAHWDTLLAAHPATFDLVAQDHARSALALGRGSEVQQQLEQLAQRLPSLDLLKALQLLDPAPEAHQRRLLQHLQQQPGSLGTAQALLLAHNEAHPPDEALQAITQSLQQAARPLQRYQCAACGFEAEQYFWQCPGCLSWDSFPPQRIEAL